MRRLTIIWRLAHDICGICRFSVDCLVRVVVEKKVIKQHRNIRGVCSDCTPRGYPELSVSAVQEITLRIPERRLSMKWRLIAIVFVAVVLLVLSVATGNGLLSCQV
jgi:hypothetical protein